MNDPAEALLAARQKITAEIRRLLQNKQAPIVVTFDGRSGAGKSTLASLIEKEFDTALIPLDDFYSADIPDSEWDRFGVEEKLKHVFDWRRLYESAIEPLLARQRARWHAFDFESGLQPDGTYEMEDEPKEREPADVILVEGAYSAGPELAHIVDLAILVDATAETRDARLRAREEKDFLENWHARWDEVEEYYFTKLRPKPYFDLIVRGE